MAHEVGHFSIEDVAANLNAKLIRRHPHIFGDVLADTPEEVKANWEAIKQTEKTAGGATAQHFLDEVPTHMPALLEAAKLGSRAAKAGFDWPDAAAVLDKLAEETDELRRELPAADPVRLEDELGDMLFVLANLARKLDIDPETALRRASAKFTRRFDAVERRLAQDGLSPAEAGLDRMETLWQAAKADEA